MLLGNVIAKRRKDLGLSQLELCEGICTQQTVSRVESQNLQPMLSILTQLCLRLGLTLNDVMSEFNSLSAYPADQPLKDVSRLMLTYQFKKAEDKLNLIKLDDIDPKLLGQYYFAKGNIALNAYQNYEDAIFNFTRIMEDHRQDLQAYTLALEGLGITYFEMKSLDKATYYFERAYSEVSASKEQLTNIAVTKVLNNVAKFYSNTAEYQKSNEITNELIAFDQQTSSLLYLDHCYYRLAYNLFKQSGETKLARVNQLLNKAEVLAEQTKSDVVQKHIAYFNENKHFSDSDNIV